MSLDKKEKKWYQNTVVVIFLLLLCFPLGLFLMWQYTKWDKNVKVAVTTAIAVIILCNIPEIKNTAQEQRKMHNYKKEEAKKDEEKSKKDESKKEEKKEEKKETPKPVTKKEEKKEEKKEINVAKEYTLCSGHYVPGADIPVGTCDVELISGIGNVHSGLLAGGINEVFGTRATKNFKNLKLPLKDVLTITGDVKVKLTYTDIQDGFVGRKNGKEIVLNAGNYKCTVDIPEGIYNIVLVSGIGNVISNNGRDVGINEVFGAKATKESKNIVLTSDKTKLIIKGDIKVKLIEQK